MDNGEHTRQPRRGITAAEGKHKYRLTGAAMPDSTMPVMDLRQAMRAFVAERDWQRFHSPKNLAMGMAIEAAELMEHFLWIDNAESRRVARQPKNRVQIGEEMADVACYLLALANAIELDLSDAILDKLAKNAQKYPAEQYRGRFRVPEDVEGQARPATRKRRRQRQEN